MTGYESHIDRQIREAQARGDFDDLPGTGKPLRDSGQELDEDWWLKQYLAREQVGPEVLPTTLRLRREVEDLPGALHRYADEDAVRERVADLNRQIRAALMGTVDGPPIGIGPVDVDDVLAQWRRRNGIAA